MNKLVKFSPVAVLGLLVFNMSCNASQHTNQQEEHRSNMDEHAEFPDSLQLDSVISDSVDYNSPESPRM